MGVARDCAGGFTGQKRHGWSVSFGSNPIAGGITEGVQCEPVTLPLDPKDGFQDYRNLRLTAFTSPDTEAQLSPSSRNTILSRRRPVRRRCAIREAASPRRLRQRTRWRQ